MSIHDEQRLRELTAAFLEENAKLNLSALRTEEACWIGNVLDSLPFLEVLPQLGEVRAVADVGTGGGFPLLPLAMALPDVTFTGIDSTGKKIDAIGRIAGKMGLKNVRLVAERAEVLGRDAAHRERYDVVLARAVAPLVTLLEYASPLARDGGHLVLWKSLHIEQEAQDSLHARSELSVKQIATHRYTLPGDWGERQLLVFRKTSPLSERYPREVGMPKGHPLLGPVARP